MFTPKTIIEEEVLPLLEELGLEDAKARVLELDELISIDQDDHELCRTHRLMQVCLSGMAIGEARDELLERLKHDRSGGISLMGRVVGLNARLTSMAKQLSDE